MRNRAGKQPSDDKKFKSVDIFAGIGGMTIGASRAGFDCVMMIDADPKCAITLARNDFRNVVCSRVEDVAYDNVIDEGVDLVCGGPPCQPWSVAGRRATVRDGRDGWSEAARAVRELRPRAFIFENVAGFLSERVREDRDRVLGAFGDYHVITCLANAADYGVAQNRRRAFVVGFRSLRAARRFRPPTPLVGPKRTVGDVLTSLGRPDGRNGHALHTASFREVPPKHTASAWDAPSKTLVAGVHGIPGGANGVRLPNSQVRHYTAREAARLQSFPDTFVLPERHCLALKQLGNAVPPLLAEQFCKSVARALSEHADHRPRSAQ